jgi:hypothetical protein
VIDEEQRGEQERQKALPAVRLKDNAGAHQAVAVPLNIAMTPLVRCSLVVMFESLLFPRSRRWRRFSVDTLCQV